MASRRTWKETALASALALAWVPLGCSEGPPAASPTPSAVPEAPAPTVKGKKRNPDDDMGIAEKREQRRKAAEATKAP